MIKIKQVVDGQQGTLTTEGYKEESKYPKYHIGDEIIYTNHGFFGTTTVTIIESIHFAGQQWVYNGNISESDIIKLFPKP